MMKAIYFSFLFWILPLLTLGQFLEEDSLQNSFNKLNAQGQKTGYWQERNGEEISRGEYVNGLKDGTWETYMSDNVLFRVENYAVGLRNGLYLQFDRRGKINTIEHYKNNQLDGWVLNYNPNSARVVKEEQYEKGMLTGIHRTFYDNGKIQEESFYSENRKHGPSKWFSQEGRLVAIYHYHDGLFEGTHRTFYDNDTTTVLMYYKNNEPDGDYKEYYRNGRTKICGRYVNGKKEGTWTEYDETGKTTKVTRYKNGVAK